MRLLVQLGNKHGIRCPFVVPTLSVIVSLWVTWLARSSFSTLLLGLWSQTGPLSKCLLQTVFSPSFGLCATIPGAGRRTEHCPLYRVPAQGHFNQPSRSAWSPSFFCFLGLLPTQPLSLPCLLLGLPWEPTLLLLATPPLPSLFLGSLLLAQRLLSPGPSPVLDDLLHLREWLQPPSLFSLLAL